MNSPATVQRYEPTVMSIDTINVPMMEVANGSWVKWEDHCRALESAQKEVAELRGKVGEVEKGVALIRTKTIGELHIPEADAILDEIAEICDALLRTAP